MVTRTQRTAHEVIFETRFETINTLTQKAYLIEEQKEIERDRALKSTDIDQASID